MNPHFTFPLVPIETVPKILYFTDMGYLCFPSIHFQKKLLLDIRQYVF